jgi:ergothioneine biosynthesis protein EgtB
MSVSSPSTPISPDAERASALRRFRQVRRASEQICAPLAIEDYVVQTMPDVSPPKWNLAHTSWFFETFLLQPFVPGYRAAHPQFGFLFNSYYEAVGERQPRDRRGMLSRPTVAEVYEYRRHIDQAMSDLIDRSNEPQSRELASLLELGLHHEQQHQELMLTDVKHILAANPLKPAYGTPRPSAASVLTELSWHDYDGGLIETGFAGAGFAFDNESPRHTNYLQPFRIASRPTTNAEYLEFIADGGYREPRHWLSEGWETVQQQRWQAPLYWERRDGEWLHFTLAGLQPLAVDEPVCHVSFFEADAFASWCGKRLLTEFEWEHAAAGVSLTGRFLEPGDPCHPQPAPNEPGLLQMFGDVWQWTASPYRPYPGYRPAAGAVGEYNGKFMCNQFVLRGGSCATPQGHIRPTYRNFFPPAARWQFSGIRLAEDA